MAYCNEQDMIIAIGKKMLCELTNDHDPSIVDSVLLGTIINKVDEIINLSLNRKYEMPLKREHAELNGIAIDLVRYELNKRRASLSDDIKAFYQHAQEQLSNIRNGVIRLDEGDTQPVTGVYIGTKRNTVYTLEEV